MTITQQPTSPSLSCAIADLVASTSAAQLAVAITVKPMNASTEAEAIYSETLLPVGGTVELAELSSLLTPFARDTLAITATATLQEKDSTGADTGEAQTVAFDVLFSQADIDISAQDFYDTYFLSVYQGTRQTAPGRLEYLHYYGTDTPEAMAEYADGSKQAFTPTVASASEAFTCIDASPDQFAAEGKTLIAYTVTAGQRRQHYIVMEAEDCAPILLFTNSFGCQELLYCTGTHTVSPTFTRQQSRIRGKLRNYDIAETRTFKATTGPLSQAAANWADDLFRSEEVYIVNALPLADGSGYQLQPGKEITITDSKSEHTNDDDSVPSFTFEYVYAQRTHNVMQLGRAGRVFDNTFDNTFN